MRKCDVLIMGLIMVVFLLLIASVTALVSALLSFTNCLIFREKFVAKGTLKI